MKYAVSKLMWTLYEMIQMLVKIFFKLSVCKSIANFPETPGYSSSFIGPGAKVSIVKPVAVLHGLLHRRYCICSNLFCRGV